MEEDQKEGSNIIFFMPGPQPVVHFMVAVIHLQSEKQMADLLPIGPSESE
jgi:hypothetical protein